MFHFMYCIQHIPLYPCTEGLYSVLALGTSAPACIQTVGFKLPVVPWTHCLWQGYIHSVFGSICTSVQGPLSSLYVQGREMCSAVLCSETMTFSFSECSV
jgi:hypothetical protein